jgi:EAL domain-containing protein (putative c-di-GMP-specific phosphodiesterase class I)
VFVKAMSEMASGLDIISVAEFVESEEVVPVLLELGVSLGQGYHLARPAADCPFPCEPPHTAHPPVDAQPRS